MCHQVEARPVVVIGSAPDALKVSMIIWPGGTRIFMREKSSGL